MCVYEQGYGHSMMNLVFRRIKLSSENMNMELGPLAGSPIVNDAAAPAMLAKLGTDFLSLSIAKPIAAAVAFMAEVDGPEVLERAPGM